MERRRRANPPPRDRDHPDWPYQAVTPKPLDGAVILPDPEDFAQWCEHPMTRFVATAFAAAAEAQRRAWLARSWEHGEADQNKLTELRTRADAYLALLQTPLSAYAGFIKESKS